MIDDIANMALEGINKLGNSALKAFNRQNQNPVNRLSKKHYKKMELGKHSVILSTNPLVVIPEKTRYEHMLDMGASGKGKTVLLRTMYYQDIVSGAGVIVIDPKDDQLPFMMQCATAAGRIPQMHSCRFRGTWSETCNPIFGKKPIELANQLHVSLFADDPDANSFYKNVAASMLRNLASLLLGYGKPITLEDIYYAVLFPKILEQIVADFKHHPQLYRQAFEINKDFIQTKSDEAKRLTKGLLDKLQPFVDSPWAKIVNTYCPDIVIEDAIAKGEIIHFGVASDILGKECYQPLVRMILANFKQVAGNRFSTADNHPCFLYCDEFSDVANLDFMEAIKKYRSANIGILIGFQSLGDLERIGEPFKKDVILNCGTKIFFNLPEADSADYVAKLLGTFADSTVSAQSYDAEGHIKGQTQKMDMRTFKISPDTLKNLDRGHCVALMPFHTGGEYPVFKFKTIYLDPKKLPEPDWPHYYAYRKDLPKDESIGLNLRKWVEPALLDPKGDAAEKEVAMDIMPEGDLAGLDKKVNTENLSDYASKIDEMFKKEMSNDADCKA